MGLENTYLLIGGIIAFLYVLPMFKEDKKTRSYLYILCAWWLLTVLWGIVAILLMVMILFFISKEIYQIYKERRDGKEATIEKQKD